MLCEIKTMLIEIYMCNKRFYIIYIICFFSLCICDIAVNQESPMVALDSPGYNQGLDREVLQASPIVHEKTIINSCAQSSAQLSL